MPFIVGSLFHGGRDGEAIQQLPFGSRIAIHFPYLSRNTARVTKTMCDDGLCAAETGLL